MKRERNPVRLFVIAAAADAVHQAALEKHLFLLWQQGLLEHWQSAQPGEKVEDAFAEARLILLLLSADFSVDSLCQEQMQRALERQQRGEIQLLPILLRPVEVTNAPFAHLALVPTNGQAVTLWANQDAAWAHITEVIRCVLEDKPLPQVGAAKRAVSAPGAERRVWMVPYPRNPFFTGRRELLAQLAETLHTGQPAVAKVPQAISGLGGIGKTQIAIEYAYQYVQDYQAVLWVQADIRENLISSYVALAGVLNLPEKEAAESAQVIAAVKRWLEQDTGYLLIVDNADDLALARDFLPVKPGGQILLTTRAQATGRFAHKLEVQTLPTEQGMLFLLRRAGLLTIDAPLEQAQEAERVVAKRLCVELGGLPLALDQAGAYIEETECSLVRYEQRYQQQRGKVLAERRGELVNDHPLPVAATWKLSFEQVERRSPVAADVLRVCAFLAPDAIPETIFTGGASQLGPQVAEVERDADVFDQAVEVLRAYSLLRRERSAGVPPTLSVHRLVQAVLKDQMGDQEQQQWGERIVRAVAGVLPPVKHEAWEQWEWILPQAMCCSEIIEQEHLRCAEATRLLQQTGWYLTERVRYREAEGLLTQGLAITEQEQGVDHLDTARDYVTLGYLYQKQGKYAEAEPLYRRVLEINEQVLGSGHPDMAVSLNNLAGLYRVQGNHAQAEPLYRRALEIREQALGPGHPDTAVSLNNLAFLYYGQGKYTEAEPLYRRVLAIWEQELGPRHFNTIVSLNNLATLYRVQGRYGEAEPLYRRALEIREQALGPGHPDTAVSLNNLAFLYYGQGKYTEAEPLYRRVLAIREQALGPGHPDTVVSLNNLAGLYQEQGKHAQAEPLYVRALKIYEQSFGAVHPNTATGLNNLANLYRDQGRYAEAEPLFVRAISIREQLLGTEHPDTATGLNNLADLYIKQNKHNQAEPLFQRALQILTQSLGLEHPYVVHMRNTQISLKISQSQKLEVQGFFENAGFRCASLDEPISFLGIPEIPLWQKKIKHSVYICLLTGKQLDGNDVLRIQDAVQGISEDIKLAFIIVDKSITAHAWLQIAALRANNFSVIPIPFTLFTENQALGKMMSASVLLDKHVERFLGQGIDPYNVRHPVFDVLNFFGREVLAHDVIERLNSGQPIGLFGLRKMGKSSLMQYTQGLMPCPTAYLDLQAGIELVGLYKRLLHAWNNDAMVRFKVDLNLSDVHLDARDLTTEFVKITQATLDRMADRNSEARLAIFLDEIELIMPPLGATGATLEPYLSLMRMLRGLVQEDGRIVLMVAGVDPAINHISRWGEEQKQNPFFLLLEELYLPPLLESDCIQMVRNIGTQVELSYSEEATVYIAQMSGGHPYLARQLCSLAYKQRHQRMGEVTKLALQQAVERFLFDPKYASSINASGLWGEVTNVKLWGEQAAKANQDLLFTLAQSMEPLAESVIINGPNQGVLRSAFFSLQELSVIHAVEHPLGVSEPHYMISFGMFHSWIRRVRLGLEG